MLKIKKSVIVLIISSLTLALLGGGQIPYLVFYMVSGVFIISYLWTAFTARKISVFQRVENKDYYVGDIITIQSYIDNDTLLPIPYVEIIDHTTDGMADNNPRPTIISMMPIERELVKSNVTIKYRGIYDIGPLELKISDVFGAFAWNRSVYTNTYVKVYPKVHRIVNFNLKSMQSFGTMSTKNKAYEDNTSISDIRKYNIGDSVKKIHWKVTAKKGSLHVKDYQMTGSTSIHILLDLKKDCLGNCKTH
ncbi:DUF58 domain-containing protein [Fonticella tunisiensis]|uniref:Uncharacterized protein DUF58 n=1 Tax=Fonticella tunisiensis TaxID=1096341 RepID=A0A4R7K570_9CLOT|nr:DUF58 domain-containing protein [Fonticella tunisiensis]TDT45664.1 uncharacterized protein DUF58 [Fonticella tunisiensis]